MGLSESKQTPKEEGGKRVDTKRRKSCSSRRSAWIARCRLTSNGGSGRPCCGRGNAEWLLSESSDSRLEETSIKVRGHRTLPLRQIENYGFRSDDSGTGAAREAGAGALPLCEYCS